MRTFLVTALRALASLKLAIFLLLALAAVLAVATLLETAHGRQYAGWYVYHSRWFVALLGLLAGNILAATAVRFPRKRRQIGFVLTHVGLLILLGGAVWTFRSGIDGQLVLAEGETGDRMMLPDTSRFDVQWAGQPRKDRLPAVFTFQAGPVDWPEDETLELGSVSGVGLKVVHYLRHARSVDNWVPEEAGSGPAVLKVSMTGPEAASGVETWLPASPMEANIGSARFAFFQAEAETLSEDFLHPPVADLGPDGLLAIHYDGKVQRVGVKENLGKKISLSADGTAVVIAEYLPNAVPQLDGRQVSAGIAPKNPLLELRIYLPKKKDPQRQMVFAKHPCLNLDGINGRVCPVKFWYHHPAVKAEPGVEFLAVPSGKLYCRIGGEGKWNSRGEVKAGDRIPAWASTAVWLVKHFPHARQEVRYLPVLPDAAGADSAPAAALLEVAAGGAKHLLWLQQGEPGQMPHPLKTAAGMLHVGFSFDTRPLGFALRLKKFIHQLNPGGTGDAAFASAVQVLDAAGKIVQEREISMNQPLVCKDFMVCQSGFLPDGQGSILGVSRDPGMFLKYLGAAMVCLGAPWIFITRARTARRGLAVSASPPPMARKESSMHSRIAASLAFFALFAAAAQAKAAEEFDWKPWRCLPVQDHGRQKPFDSLAWESWRMIGNLSGATDPQTGRKLDAAGLYLSVLFDWPGWEQKPAAPRAAPPAQCGRSHSMAAGMDACPAHAASFPPDRWDQSPLILVESLELRRALGMPEEQKLISPCDLGKSPFRDPQTQSCPRFSAWAQTLAFRPEAQLSAFEKKGMELARRLRDYQELRAGRRLEAAPLANSPEGQWASIDYLLRISLDDRTDPKGLLRQLKRKFLAVRAAYLANSPREFNRASAAFLAAARELGPQLGAYPALTKIDAEVAYNHWVPFRFAWALAIFACIGVLLAMGTSSKSLYVAALAAFAISIAAALVGFGMRVWISGRAPVTNMYESVTYVGLGVALLGMVLELVYRKRCILAAASAISAVALILADNCPAILDPSLQPLQPILRNNFWLVTHVMSITLSYAAFALALGIGNLTLGYFIIAPKNQSAIESLSRFTYRALQVGVVLLAVGTFLGGVWAASAWGRFWGWDPKEVWALISLLGYIAVLHARYAGWVKHFGLAVLSVACFALVMAAWYGVNFLMGAGLHSYGFSASAGQAYVGGAIVLQTLFIFAAAARTYGVGGNLVPSL